ncbi:7ad0395c-5429-47cb-bf5f-e5c62e7f5a29-CDS [Sclerotinia trifoliorum]|uniref:7ad0395c-5429-47cb-bf5f-e5c62e7f5a29-CDS n=1 Tax=Sclerotinia trifoliorum TaxID=28548 RepID=A0A8H2ZIV4_9HELO|nr:7ad0395c-5429-47cb-bf5f-e5c62e7f5a29-CDS [Sclerotinia trifoliorum]
MVSPMEPFPFLRLPGEIRNQIYELLLCNVQEPEPLDGLDIPSAVTIAKRNIHPQLLRTCRQVHEEAKYVMLTKNRFVEVQFGGQGRNLNYSFLDLISLWRVPILRLKRCTTLGDRVFNGCFMRHQISSTGDNSAWNTSKADSILLLHRNLNKLLPAIMQSQCLVSLYLNGTSIHNVTLLDRFVPVSTIIKEFELTGRNASGCQFSVEVLQNNPQTLLSPYSPSFQQESSFTVYDRTVDSTGHRLIHSKKAVPNVTAESVMKDLSQLTEIGNNYRSQGIWGYAAAFYQYVDYKISVLMSHHNPTIVRLLVEEGGMIEDQIAELHSTICYYRAKNAVGAMRQFEHSHREELEDLFDTVTNMGAISEAPIFPGFTQSPMRNADHIYLQAVAWKLMGDQSRLNMDMALETVNSGLAIIPYHPELNLEKKFLIRKILITRLDFSRSRAGFRKCLNGTFN